MNEHVFGLENLDIPLLYLSSSELCFNRLCIDMLSKPEYVSIAIDRKNKKLAIKNGKKSRGFLCCYSVDENGQCDTKMRIRSSILKSEISKITGALPEDKPLRFIVDLDVEKGLLIVDLTKNIK